MDKVVELLIGLAWPLLIAGLAFWLRDFIFSALDAFRRQFAAGANLKWKDFEFTGVNLSAFNKVGLTGYSSELAAQELLDERNMHYARNKNLFLVHRVHPTGGLHKSSKLPLYDVMVKLTAHKNYGKLNDVKRVEYYLGHYFGNPKSQFGSKYIVENGTDNFAIEVDAYGPMLCEANLIFHDGSSAKCSRYLDFEGVNYSYDQAHTESHDDKVRANKGSK